MKRQLRRIYEYFRIYYEYFGDCRSYIKYNYHNHKMHTENALTAKILRQTHIIEKGMSLSHPRKGFGEAKVLELIQFLEEYFSYHYGEENVAVQNAIHVLNFYISFQKKMNHENVTIISKVHEFDSYQTESFPCGIETITWKQMDRERQGNFKEFFMSRHSVRQFSKERVPIDKIKQAVQLALKSPSACNRQPVKVYVLEDEKKNHELNQFILGNTGFSEEVSHYLVITSDISAYYDAFERNQVYVDGSLFAMGLVEALHYYDIASCMLQNGENKSRNKKIKALCQIPNNEKVILFIAIGCYKDSFQVAISKRKNVEDIMIMR